MQRKRRRVLVEEQDVGADEAIVASEGAPARARARTTTHKRRAAAVASHT